jgi:hypothetical protein
MSNPNMIVEEHGRMREIALATVLTVAALGGAACSAPNGADVKTHGTGTELGTVPGTTPGTGPEGTGVTETTAATIVDEAARLEERKRALTIDTVDQNGCVDKVKAANAKATDENDKVLVVPSKDGRKSIIEIKRDNIGALLPVDPANPKMRAFSDAIDTPFLADKSDKEALMAELQLEVCQNPLFGTMVANEFANMQIGDVKVVELNPWLKGYEGDPSTINDKAKEFMPLMDTDKDPKDISAAEVDVADAQNIKYQELANYLNTMLGRFQNNGNQDAGRTSFNYHLDDFGLQVKGLPEISLNDVQYDANAPLSAITLTLTRKDGGCDAEVGFNLWDKRAEAFHPNFKCEEETPPADTTDTTTPNTNTGGPGTPPATRRPNGPTPSTPTATTTPGYPNKDPSKDYNNNNGPNNGPGSGGQPGGEGVSSTTGAPTTEAHTTTTKAGNATTTGKPVESTAPTQSTVIAG